MLTGSKVKTSWMKGLEEQSSSVHEGQKAEQNNVREKSEKGPDIDPEVTSL